MTVRKEESIAIQQPEVPPRYHYLYNSGMKYPRVHISPISHDIVFNHCPIPVGISYLHLGLDLALTSSA